MNTKFILMMFMITAVILVSEAKIHLRILCVEMKYCERICRAKGCKHDNCIRASSGIIGCDCTNCRQCSK
uniref:AKTx n=1 Tax=Hadrurus spadix TaxID=141984 RepID=A0A1W7RB28_9SCOR